MTAEPQIVISLARLILPEGSHLKTILLSVLTPSSEHFISNARKVKGEKVNFYRQNIFLHQISNSIGFNIYQCQDQDHKKLVISIIVENQQLSKIQKRPTSFKSCFEGFQLRWDSWVFVDGESSLDGGSDRNYSELDLPFENICESNDGQLDVSCQSKSIRGFRMQRMKQNERRSSSTQEASSSQQEPQRYQNGNNNLKDEQMFEERQRLDCSKNASLMSPNRKHRPHMKSQIYTKLVSNISGLLSRGKSP